MSAAAIVNSRSRSRLGSHRLAFVSVRAISCIQAVISAARVTMAHQMWFWCRLCSGRLRSPVMLLWMSREPEPLLCGLAGGAQHGPDGGPGDVVLAGAKDG